MLVIVPWNVATARQKKPVMNMVTETSKHTPTNIARR